MIYFIEGSFAPKSVNFFALESFKKLEEKNESILSENQETLKYLGSFSVFDSLLKLENYRQKGKNFLMFSSIFEEILPNAITIPLEVKLMNNGIYYIQIGRFTTARDVCLYIKEKEEIKSWLDFKLFLCFSEEDETLIDDEEFMYQVLDWRPELFEQEEKKGACQGCKRLIFSKFFQIFLLMNLGYFYFILFYFILFYLRKLEGYLNSLPVIKYKKYLYLTKEQELQDLKKDARKLDLVTEQLFIDVSNGKYKLSCDEYGLVIAIKLYLQNSGLTPGNSAEFSYQVEPILPLTLLTVKDFSFWIDLVGNLIILLA